MKSNEYWGVKCPFYGGEDKRKIICEGPEKGTFLHHFFPSTAALREFRHVKCVGDYRKCRIAQMLLRKYEEEDSNA